LISGETMSIFEPIPRESRWDAGAQGLDDATPDDHAVPSSGRSLDPRSIMIAGASVTAIVIAGLIASNMAEPEARPERLVPSRVEPGAAAVEQAEAKRSVPAVRPSASPSAVPVDEANGDADTDDVPAWEEPEDSRWSGEDKWNDKPGKGNGRGRG